MGSWNSTCGVTQLPICTGDQVALFLLIDNTLSSSWDTNGHCYSNHYWTPRTIQLYGTYDDYGGYEIEDGWNLQFSIKCLQADVLEMTLGDNEYHDIEVTKEKINDWGFIQTAIHDNRLLVTSRGGNRHIGLMAVHRHVFDELVNHIHDVWDGKFNIATIKEASGDYIQQLREHLENPDFFQDAGSKKIAISAGLDISDRFLMFHPKRNIFGDYFESTGQSHLSSILGVHQIYRNLLAENLNSPEIDDIITEMSKYVMFHSMFSQMRKTWMPQAGAGSQSEELEVYETAISAATEVIKKRKAWYNE